MNSRQLLGSTLGALVLAIAADGAIALEMVRDYEYKTPIPATKQVTIRKNISDLPQNKLFEPCRLNSYLHDFAESSNYLIMVCPGQGNDLRKYWSQKDKVTGNVLRLVAEDKPRSQPSLWKSGDLSLSLYFDGVGRGNAYLEVYNLKAQQGYGEALLYHYRKVYERRR